MLGKCSNKNCNAQIIDLDKKGNARFLENYRDHWFESNLGLMRIGVCSECRSALVTGENAQKVVQGIISKHQEHWRGDINAPEGFADMIILDTNSSEEKYLDRRNKAQLEEIRLRDEGIKEKQEDNKLKKK